MLDQERNYNASSGIEEMVIEGRELAEKIELMNLGWLKKNDVLGSE